DANVGRFVKMLTQFKSRTQFIVITHNPRTTTEAADAVYGVTMQEPGVSSLVSVRMRGAASVDEVLGTVNAPRDGAVAPASPIARDGRGMSARRRHAALALVVGLMAGVANRGFAQAAVSVSLVAVNDSISPAPQILVQGTPGPPSLAPYNITLEVSLEPLF